MNSPAENNLISLHEECMRVKASAEVIHDESAVTAAYDRMAEELARRIADSNPIILPVMVGGLFAASELLKRLDFPFQMDYLHASRYRGDIHGGELVWKVMPSIDLSGRTVVVIDDILDEGHTLAAVQRALLAQQPAELLTVALVKKIHDRRDPAVEVDIIGLEADDRYLFGCGMDYKGYLRQYPAIYAVNGA